MASTNGKATPSKNIQQPAEVTKDSKAKPSLKVVAHMTDGRLIKGHSDIVPATDLDSLLKRNPVSMPMEMNVRMIDTGNTIKIPLTSLKALFFVKSFEGKEAYKEIKFFEGHPAIEGLWVRLKFLDHEWTEGVVRNSHHFLTDPGFLMKPPDPQSNNEILYIIKAYLTEFQVLGVRQT
ncbi:MAG: DUF6982 domain-containing protein [Terriglobia bacterium]